MVESNETFVDKAAWDSFSWIILSFTGEYVLILIIHLATAGSTLFFVVWFYSFQRIGFVVSFEHNVLDVLFVI